MLPGSFCNADTMANIITVLSPEYHILAVDYNGQYAGSEKPFTSRSGEAEEIHELVVYKMAYRRPCGLFRSRDGEDASGSRIRTYPLETDHTVYICMYCAKIRKQIV